MSNTKENIISAALRLFARDGYEAVSTSAIAGELCMTKAALYKHFTSKRDIFDSILAKMEQLDAERAKKFNLPEGTPEQMGGEYKASSIESLICFSRAQFQYWTEDEFASAFRKMLTLEQYRSEEMGRLYQQYVVSGPMMYVMELLKAMGVKNAMRQAVYFYAPMYLLYSAYDGAQDKAPVLAILDAHFKQLAQELGGQGR